MMRNHFQKLQEIFLEKKIPVSQEIINLLSHKSSGDRKNLKNELQKIENFLGSKKKIKIEQILKLTNLAENYSIKDLVNACLAKNRKDTLRIINENIFAIDDCIVILRTMLIAANRLLQLLKQKQKNPNLDQLIMSHKPPIFWKEKSIVKEQLSSWKEETISDLIYKINHIELLIKKNNNLSLNIIIDFLIEQTCRANSSP